MHARCRWTLEEARAFLAAVASDRLYAAFHLRLVTGMRRGELLGLRWSDVELVQEGSQIDPFFRVDNGAPRLAGEPVESPPPLRARWVSLPQQLEQRV